MKNFIPKQYKNEQMTIRMTLDKLEKVDEIAGKYHLSRSAFINQCVDFALDHMMDQFEVVQEEGE